MYKIMVIDDDATIRETMEDILKKEGYEVKTFSTGKQAIEAFKKEANYDVVICDMILPDINGRQVLLEVMKEDPYTPVIFITGYASVENAVNSIKEGAYNYLEKPINISRLRVAVNNAIEKRRIQLKNVSLEAQLKTQDAMDKIIGESRAIQEIKKQIRFIAPTDATVLLIGESGTGKELIADAIVASSPRANKPYVKVNSAAIPSELLESELFGHEKGAFTHAVKTKKGKFELADTGTILLDEIGEMAIEVQAKLLRVMEYRTFERVGGEYPITVDVRIIASTNANLKQKIKEGKFREDLYYRLNVISIEVPPLRERKEDIPLLVNFFLHQINSKYNMDKTFDKKGMELLMSYSWPGNVRQLKNLVEKLAILSPTKVISTSMILQDIGTEHYEDNTFSDTLSLEEIERKAILKALKKTGGNKTEAARILGIGTKTLYRKLEKYEKEGLL